MAWLTAYGHHNLFTNGELLSSLFWTASHLILTEKPFGVKLGENQSDIQQLKVLTFLSRLFSSYCKKEKNCKIQVNTHNSLLSNSN